MARTAQKADSLQIIVSASDIVLNVVNVGIPATKRNPASLAFVTTAPPQSVQYLDRRFGDLLYPLPGNPEPCTNLLVSMALREHGEDCPFPFLLIHAAHFTHASCVSQWYFSTEV